MRFLSTLAASVLGTLIALILLFLFFLFVFFALSLSTSQVPTVQSGSVLVLPIDGPIPERAASDPFAQAFADAPAYDLHDVQTALRNAATDDRISGVWLKLKGTSAGWSTLSEVREALVGFREASGKPVYASAADFGMSERTYFVASAADSVFAAPMSPFEWNGFSITTPFFAETLDRLSIEPKIVRVGAFKGAVEPFLRRDLSSENRMQLEALLETQNDHIKTAIAATRPTDVETLESIADESALLDAHSALEAGMIDDLRYENEVLDLFRDRLAVLPAQSVPQIEVDAYARVPAADANVTFTGSGNVAVVYAEGNIVSGKTETIGGSASSIGSETFIEAMESARTSSTTQAVVLRINSPGGSAAASEVMWHAVKRTAAEKPVIVSMGNQAASGGYYIAAAADSIVATPTTVTGSIGIFGLLFNAEGFFNEELGITFDQVSTSPLADLYSVVEPFSDREKRLLQQSLDRSYDTFLKRVAEGRGMTSDAVRDVAQGRVWSGQDAQEVGLVDQLGGLETALALAGKAGGLGDGPYRTRILPRPKTFLEVLNRELSGQAARAWMRWTTSEWEHKVWSQLDPLRRMVEQHGTAQARLPYAITIE